MEPSRASLASRWFLAVALLAVAYWIFSLAVLRTGVPHPLDDTWEDGVVARRLLEGDWFRSHTLYPPLWELRDPRSLTVPVLVHGPLLPLLWTLPIRLAGPQALDRVSWIAAAFALLSLVPLFRFAARHFGEPVAAAACGLFTFSPLLVAGVDHYLSVVTGALLVALTLDLSTGTPRRPALAGLAAGLGYLVRPEMLVAAPILAALIAGEGTRRRAPWVFLGVFAACGSWWWWTHWRATGSPFFNLSSYLLVSFTPAHPGDSLIHDFAATPARFPEILAAALPTLPAKWAHFAPHAIKRALSTPTVATGWLVPFGVAAVLARRETRRLAVTASLLAAIPLAACVLLVPIRLYPVPFLPLYAIGAALGARWMFERLPAWAHRPRAWIGTLLLVVVPSVAMALRFEEHEARMNERWLEVDRPPLAALASAPGERPRLMFSDTPDFVAWSTGRPTLWVTREEFLQLYAAGREPLPAGLPGRIEPRDTWFHRGDPRNPAGQAGAPIGVPPDH